MKTTFTKIALSIACAFALDAEAQVTTETFETFTLSPNTYYTNTVTPNWQTSQATFMYQWNTAFGGYWESGSAYTNVKDTVDGTYTNLYGNITGTGYSGSSNYVTARSGAVVKINNASIVTGFFITNTTYAWKVIKNGNSFSRKFGDTTGTLSGTSIPQGEYPDWFKVTVVGYRNGIIKLDTAKFYLADYRYPGTANDIAISNWRFLNTAVIGIVDSLKFILTSSDNGSFGMNTPSYFSLDNFVTYTTVGLEELHSIADVSLFPNPVNEHLTIKYAAMETQSIKLCVYDISGNEIINRNEETNVGQNSVEINTNSLRAGVYFVEIKNDNGSKKIKFIKL